MNSKERRLIQASIVGDARGLPAPGVLLLEGCSVLASGTPASVGAPGPEVRVEDLRGHFVCPPLVNAHVHLDLSDLAPLPDGADFDAWLGAIIDHRRTQHRPGAVEAAVARGVQASLAGGCPFVGDISGTIRSFEALAASELAGVGFLELFGHGDRVADSIALLEQMVAREGRIGPATGIHPGLSPHAPYSTSRELFEAVSETGLPVATHLAESPEELVWCESGTGPFARRLTQMGYSSGSVRFPGAHPLSIYPPVLSGRNALVAHANYADPEHLELLSAHRCTVVYCPRAYRYFGHPRTGSPPHGWRHMR
ncbi:MAG: amidohydrolase family protein, partial [Planctomycetota bacterium]|nr:amidohydrolase family protein [Planctomycetota bacterium]